MKLNKPCAEKHQPVRLVKSSRIFDLMMEMSDYFEENCINRSYMQSMFELLYLKIRSNQTIKTYL